MSWEYRYAERPLGDGFEEWLNELGAERWEIVMCTQGVKGGVAGPQPVWVMVFKRPKFAKAVV